MQQIRVRATTLALPFIALLGTFFSVSICGQTPPDPYVDEALIRGLNFQFLNASPGNGQGFAAVRSGAGGAGLWA